MYISLLVLLIASSAFSTPLDDMIDEVIYETAQAMVKKGLDEIQLPHFDEDFEEPIIGPLTISGNFNVRNGIFKNLTTIYRIGSVNETNNADGSMTFAATFGMKDVELRYDFGYKVLFAKSEKSIEVQCTENSIYFEFTVAYDDQQKCNFTINQANLETLGGFSVKIQPDGLVTNLEANLLNKALNKIAKLTKAFVNMNLTDFLNKILLFINVCSYLPV